MKLLQNYTMRFYKILFSLLLIFLIACHHDNAPGNLIEEDEFILLLVDIHIADGYLNTGSQIPDSLSYRANGLYDAIFKKHHVDSVQFKKSYQYYSIHLEEMGKIYKAVVEQLTAKSDSIIKQQAAEEMKRSRRTADSVAKATKIEAVKRDSVLKSQKAKVKTSSATNIANHK
jgi:hypothetical protein